MLLKEQGWVLVIDQASNVAGVSLLLNGELRGTTELRSRASTDTFSRRLQTQLPQLTAFLDAHLPHDASVTKIVFEGVRARLVLITVGAFLCCPRINAKMCQRASFIESTSWKKWAQMRGAVGPLKDIKGVKALRESGWDMVKYPVTSDDIADSLLIYQTWRDRP